MNKIQLEEITPFTTKIHILKCQQFNQLQLINHVENARVFDHGQSISNRGGWQSSSIFNPSEDIIPVLDEITSALTVIYSSMGIRTKPNLKGYWMNINNRYSSNNSHSHAGCYYSAVLYIQTPDNCGNLVFERDDSLSHYIYDTDLTENNFVTYSIKPTVGEVIIFPAYLRHFVEQNLTEDKDDRRISIAFNFR